MDRKKKNSTVCCSSILAPRETAYDWCLLFQCETCAKAKFWCQICSAPNYYETLKAAERHFSRFHTSETVEKVDTTNVQKSVVLPHVLKQTITSATRNDHYHACEGRANREFYKHEQNNNGLNYLINYSAHGYAVPSPKLQGEEIRYHLLMARLCTSISRSKREMLGEILEITHKFLTEDRNKTLGHMDLKDYDLVTPRIPTSYGYLRSMYMEGKRAICSNVPQPRVTLLDQTDRHAYVSLIDILADVVSSSGGLVEKLKLRNRCNFVSPPASIRSIMETNRYRMLLERASERCQTENPIVFWATIWSDDHEPNNLLQNRGSVHLQTISIACDPSSNDPILRDSRSRTYPVSISAKGSDHDEVEQLFSKELKQLSREEIGSMHTFIWNPRIQDYEEVYLEVFVSLQDQPERRSANYLLGGNSQFHTRWLWSCDVPHISKCLPACNSCLSSLLDMDQEHSDCACNRCLCFSFARSQSPMSHYPTPKGYPQDGDQNEDGLLCPFQLTYDRLKAAVALSRNKVEGGQWTINTASTFLKTYCLNDKIIDHLLINASHRHHLSQSSSEAIGHDEDNDLLRQISNKHPDLLEDKPCPGPWNSPITLHQRIDVIMHLLFLGVMKSSAFLIRDWTKLKERGTAFATYVKNTLQTIPTIPWCATAAYTGDKLGGWISENYMALARLSKWFYCQLKFVVTDFIYIAPNGPVEKWKASECHHWLKSHGVKIQLVINDTGIDLPDNVTTYLRSLNNEKKPLTRATVANLRKIISCYLNSDQGPPSLVSNRLPTADMIVKMICAFHSMAAAIMSPSSSNEHSDRTERFIKIFLSIYSRIEESIRLAEGGDTAKQKPDWVTHYNFTSLLNLPAVMREFGPLRNLWEGGECGEKFIRRSKDALSNGLRGNWEMVTAKKILTDQSIRNLCQRSDSEASKTSHARRTLEMIRQEAKIYKNTSEVWEIFAKARPLSVVVNRSCMDPCKSVFAVAYDEGTSAGVTLVEFKQLSFDVSDGCHHYFNWSSLLSVHDERNEEIVRVISNNVVGGMLLPKLRTQSEETTDIPETTHYTLRSKRAKQQSYTLLVSDWRELDQTGSVRTIGPLQFTSFP